MDIVIKETTFENEKKLVAQVVGYPRCSWMGDTAQEVYDAAKKHFKKLSSGGIQNENWVFSEDEKILLRNVERNYLWLARDADGGLHLFEHKPVKHYEYDYLSGNEWMPKLGGSIGLGAYSHMFTCITWNDKHPCEFRKFL